MKPPALLLGTVVLGLTVGFPAYAALLGSADGSDLSSGTTTLPFAMYYLNQAAPTTLNTTITGNNTTLVRRYNNRFYYSSSSGLQRIAVGGTTPKMVKSANNLKLVASKGDLLVVSSTTSSFVFDLKKGKSTSFKPRVKSIGSADLTSDGKVLVMLAKNSKGVSKLFLSQGNASTVKEFALPKGASSCTEVSIASNGKLAAAQCVYDATIAVVIINLNGQTVGATNKKVVSTFAPTTAEWVNDTTLVAGGLSSNPATLLKEEYHSYTIRSGKVVSTKKLEIDNSGLIPAGATISVPSQILRISKTKFYYALLSVAASAVNPANSSVTSIVGMYDFTTKGNTTLVADGKYNLLTEAPTST